MFEREVFLAPATEVAPLLLGAILSRTTLLGRVSVRLTEVEAYLGQADPGSHAFRGPGRRNAVMYGAAGHLYTYFSYGMHVCANLVCSPTGVATAVLLRAGEVVEGVEIARERRTTSRSDSDLARGPARLTVALGIELADGGADLALPPFELELSRGRSPYDSGPRTGVSGAGGTLDYPWRFWIPEDPTVSLYRRSAPRPGR